MSLNKRTFTTYQKNWLEYLFHYEPTMRKAIDSAIKVAQQNQEIKKARTAKQKALNGIDKMIVEEDRKAETWNDPMGVQLLFRCLEYIPHTDCWECEKTCECGFVGSVWATKMVRFFRNDRIECEECSNLTLSDDSSSENCYTNV